MDHLLLSISVLCLVILLSIVVLKTLGQPYSIAYILAGIFLAPNVTGLFNDSEIISELGEVGILFLMFFLGLGFEIPDRKDRLSITFLVILLNGMLTTLVFKLLHYNWNESFYGGTLLSNTGELGILVCNLARQSAIVDEGFSKISSTVTAGALLLSTLVMSILRFEKKSDKNTVLEKY